MTTTEVKPKAGNGPCSAGERQYVVDLRGPGQSQPRDIEMNDNSQRTKTHAFSEPGSAALRSLRESRSWKTSTCTWSNDKLEMDHKRDVQFRTCRALCDTDCTCNVTYAGSLRYGSCKSLASLPRLVVNLQVIKQPGLARPPSEQCTREVRSHNRRRSQRNLEYCCNHPILV